MGLVLCYSPSYTSKLPVPQQGLLRRFEGTLVPLKTVLQFGLFVRARIDAWE